MSRIYWVFSIFILFVACKEDIQISEDVLNIPVEVRVERFEQQFYKSSSSELNGLKKEFPFMFPTAVNDSVWIQKAKNEDELFLFEETQKKYTDLNDFKNQLGLLFKHVKYDFSEFKEPEIITYISNLDYGYKIVDADSLLFVSLDMYLGANHEVYQDFPKYLTQNYTKERMIVDVANEFLKRYYRKLKSRTFLDRMINEAKFVYALDVYLPLESDANKIGYTHEKINWAMQNEGDIWKYFIEKELLYSNDATLNSRFIDVAPFSKFYLESDNDSPGQIGVWMGWQIIRSYMNNDDVTLQKLMSTSPETIFRKSKYKPKR
ncbi:MAG: gliding motility lipoprotein GldB [Flavobacteriaceae bacterium]|nr:gliding motility lipoprotein GldB [Flavobacteriaceae bacterium]